MRFWRPPVYHLPKLPFTPVKGGSVLCFLQFFMRVALLAPFAIFFQQNFTLHFADVFAHPVIDALAFAAL